MKLMCLLESVSQNSFVQSISQNSTGVSPQGDSPFTNPMSTFIDDFLNLLGDIKTWIVNTYESLRGGNEYLQNMMDNIDSLSQHNVIEGVNLNTYIGMIRFVVGDVIFYQMYVILMVLVIMEIYHLFTKIFSGVLYLVEKITNTKFVKLIGESAIFKKILSFFGAKF